MADEKEDKTDDGEASSGKKKVFLAAGGGVAVLALAFVLAMMGVPGKVEKKTFQGPFVAPLTAEKVQVNLLGGKGYLILDLNVVYEAYEEAYFTERSMDPLTIAEIRDALVALASSKSREDVSDRVNKPIFMEEIRTAVEPLLFPVLLGDAQKPQDADSDSGLAFSYSGSMPTFRGAFEDHVIHLDADGLKIQFDDGPEQEWSAEASDFELTAPDGSAVFLDMTGVDPTFVGDVKIGTMGRPLRVLLKEILIQ